ncbi:MAG: hypothetical protein IGS49_15850 [Chlorogloeopsis fritschii C42_A2020_084]|uniref:hypothetical protein n=1 Tax=Chlorogloeopsis fritschii TaxID=1124 RepID=UPI001A08B231|nr:hypothetical protein [Chlorogloeopsis fritschii]MBF2006896.1 hypothetical protein [Chlorogloeopsis fritschii C42_A2020_084]
MVEGKNDFYTLNYLQEIIIKPEQKIALLPGTGSGSLDTAIRLYYAWGRNFIVLLDSDAEGRKQKIRYKDGFNGIIQDRLFVLEDVDNSWSNCTMEKIFDSNDLLKIQKSVFAGTQNFDKKQFNIAIQENLAKRVAIPLSNTTIEKFKRLLDFLTKSLAKSS